MKLKSIFEADESNVGEHIANFTEELSKLQNLSEENQSLFLDLGAEAIKVGYAFKRTVKGFEFHLKRYDDLAVVRLMPVTGEMTIYVTNEGDQSFVWENVSAKEFKQYMEGELKELTARLFDLIESLDSCQRYIGQSPESSTPDEDS